MEELEVLKSLSNKKVKSPTYIFPDLFMTAAKKVAA